VFYINVAKVDRDVSHVAMAIHACVFSKCFICFFKEACYKRVYFRCCIYFMQMLQVFYISDVAYACDGFSSVFRRFTSFSNVCCKCFSCLNVSFRCCKSSSNVACVSGGRAGGRAVGEQTQPGSWASRPARRASRDEQVAGRGDGRANRCEQRPDEQTRRAGRAASKQTRAVVGQADS
jgi:hypothetical protein